MVLKRSYQTLLLFTSVLLFVMSCLIPLNQASAEVINRERYQMDWAYSPQYGKDVRTELLKNASGQIAYCLVYGLKSPNGEDLPEAGKTDDVSYRVLMNGYPQKTPENLGVSNWKEAHYATQLALWNALGQISVDELQFKNAAVEKAAKNIIHAANQSQDTQDVWMNVIPTDKQEAQLNGEYFETTTTEESFLSSGEDELEMTYFLVRLPFSSYSFTQLDEESPIPVFIGLSCWS